MSKISAAHAEDLERMQRFAAYSERTRIAIIIEGKICRKKMITSTCSHEACAALAELLHSIKPKTNLW